jgi:AcrR family transcriptional regulator
MIEMAGEDGYGAITVRELARRAGVSTRSFYEHFGEKEECFLSTYEWLVRRTARRMVGSQKKAGQDWRQRLRLGLGRLTRDLAAEPEAAHLLLVEAFAVGPLALGQVSHAEAIFEAVLNASLSQAPEEEMPPPFAARAIVSGATRVARARVLAGRVEELPELADELTEWALSYACGAGELSERRGRAFAPSIHRDVVLEDRRAETHGDERELILAAVAKLTASGGYGALSPPRIRAAAGVSRRAFDAHFEGLESCFLATVEQLSTDVIADAEQEGAAARTWPAGLHRAMEALCERIGRDRVLSRLAFTESIPPGSDGVRGHERLLTAIAERFRASAPPGRGPSALAAEASVGAVWDSIHRQVAAGREARLPRQVEAFAFLLLAPAMGGAGATDAIRAGQSS